MAIGEAFQTNIKTGAYPASGTLIFGSDYGHSNFITPMARFAFYDNLGGGQATGSPIIFMRMSGAFQSGLQNGYSESQNIFGSPDKTGNIGFAYDTVKGGVDALLKQLVGGAAGAQSFIASAGQSGKAQYEFMTRKVLNTFQQLIYQGPTFRRFPLTFIMKPTSLAEAEKMTDIIKTFRIASSAKGAGNEGTNDEFGGIRVEGSKTDSTTDNKTQTKEEIDKENAENTKLTVEQINFLFGGGNVPGSSNRTFSFGYPDMCKFQIVLQRITAQGSAADTALAEVFGSEYCVIENVQVDYGAQNKMVFFSSDGTGGKYYPSEVTLSIGLRETTLPLAGQIEAGHGGTRTIF
jgi:hypothetical protein